MRGVEVQRIAAGPWEQNCYVVGAASGDAVVVDPGGAAERILDHLAARRLTVHAVLATHGHHDHVGAAAEVVSRCGAPFGVHSADADALARVNLCRFAFHRLGPVETPAPDIDLAAVTQLAFGELEISVLHTPGHSPGSVCFEIDGELFTGDTLMAPLEGARMPGLDPDALAASVRLLTRLHRSDSTVHPGHGEPATLGQLVPDAILHQ